MKQENGQANGQPTDRKAANPEGADDSREILRRGLDEKLDIVESRTKGIRPTPQHLHS